MAQQLHLIKQTQGILIPATQETSDFLQSKCKLGAVLEADFKLVRNPAFHRRYFALLNLGFEYWEPTGGAISSNERRLITGYAKYLAAYGGSESALLDAAGQYLDRIAEKRSGYISICKSFDAYRAWVIVEAGHYDAIQLPDGTLKNTLAAFLSQAWTNASSRNCTKHRWMFSGGGSSLVHSTACRKLRTPPTSF